MPEYLRRTIEKEMPNLNKNFKVLLMTGLRQVGKTTTFKEVGKKDRKFVSLDNIEDRELATFAPQGFFLKHPLPLCIDEVQLAPELFRQLKFEVDRSDRFGLAWLTGSQKFSLMKSAGDSLFGRMFEIQLMPLSLYERNGIGLLQKPYLPSRTPCNNLEMLTKEDIWPIIWQGAWPRVIEKPKHEREQFFNALVSLFLDKDIRSLENVDKLISFKKFITGLAFSTGQELRINKLCEIAGISAPTVNRWLSITEASGLIYLLKAFSHESLKTLTKSPKIYFTDTGLAAYLCNITSPEELARHTHSEAFFETFVIMEILKSWRHNGLEPHITYYRNPKNGAEIDLIIHTDGKYHPIEIKASNTPYIEMTKNFRELERIGVDVGLGAIICTTTNPRYLSSQVIAHSILNI